jgi:hypothetical protein
MTQYEVEDQAHWFSQDQTDRFQEILVKKTGNPKIAREAGRFTTSHEGMGPVKQYTLGLMSLASVYLLIDKVYALLSRGVNVKTKRLGPNKVEIVSAPKPGVNEKPYQCENRIGALESIAESFTDRFANVEHPLCFHKGDSACLYIMSWQKASYFIWKQVRNISLLISIVISLFLFFFLPFISWVTFVLLCSVITLTLSFYSELLEKKELSKTVETQGDVAQDLLDEMNIRHSNALFIQEIGQVTASILNTDNLLKAVVRIMEIRTDFDRGMIMLANKDKTRLFYTAGYGYDQKIEELL